MASSTFDEFVSKLRIELPVYHALQLKPTLPGTGLRIFLRTGPRAMRSANFGGIPLHFWALVVLATSADTFNHSKHVRKCNCFSRNSTLQIM